MNTFRASLKEQVDGAPVLQTAGFPVCLPAEITARSRFGEVPGCGPSVVQSSGLSTGPGEGFTSNQEVRCRKRKPSLSVSAS